MSNLTKGLILLLVVLGIGVGLVYWKKNVGSHASASYNSITKEEVEMLIGDIGKQNPMALKRLQDDPSLRKTQLENLKQLLAFASEAQREGITNEDPYRQELDSIRSEVIAVNYDREMNSDKGPMPPFGFITEDQMNQFWSTESSQGFFQNLKDKIGLGKRDRELAFKKFLDTKVAMLKENNPQMKDKEITEEETKQAREFYAKINIYKEEFEDKAAKNEIPEDTQKRVALQVKLQQAQFLARIYAAKLADKTKVTDEDVDKYIAEHPEFNSSEKKAKAQEILARAKAGEDFAKLANEFSEDPGNKGMGENDPDKGGLYENVRVGQMVKPFETAALALEPGQISPELVETDFGYHIIKLERKGEAPAPEGNQSGGAPAQPTVTYDTRHILISTGFKDPANPMGRETPVKVFVRQKLEEEKEKKIIDDIVAKNNIQVPDDFSVPEVSEEDMKKMMEEQQKMQMQQMGLPPDAAPGEAPPAPPAGKPAAKPPAPAKK